MKFSDHAINPHPRLNLPIERTISENSAYQEAEFNDKLICTETRRNLTPSKPEKKVLELAPKQKLSSVIYSLKSNEFISKIQHQKKQALKKQWMAMKNSHRKTHKQSYKNVSNANQTNKASNTSNLFHKNGETKAKHNELELKCISIVEENKNGQIPEKNEEKRKRSKTQMLIHDYELEKIESFESSYLQQNPLMSNQNKQKFGKSKESNLLSNTYSQKFDSKIFIKSEPKQKTYLQQMRQATQTNFVSPDNRMRSKMSEKLNLSKNEIDDNQSHCLSRSKNPISKTVMVQKIINLRKTFNDKYKNPKSKSILQSSFLQTSLSRPKQSEGQFEGQNPMIPYMSFPVMNIKVARKLTFQQLFHNEKKKMDLLKKYIDKGGVFNSFTHEQKTHKSESAILSQDPSASNLMIFSQLSESKCFLVSSQANDSKFETYMNHGKNLYRGKAKWSDLQEEEIKTIKSKSKLLPEDLLNIESIFTLDSNKTLENDLVENSNDENQTCHKKQKTYGFDEMNKNLQKIQIKELRHKYLYSTKRKLSKEEFNKYGISMVQVHGRDQTTLRKLKFKSQTEMITGECLEIQKKVPQNWDRMGKTSANFIKMNLERKKAASLGKPLKIQTNEQGRTGPKFEPWENQMAQNFYEEEMSEFPD